MFKRLLTEIVNFLGRIDNTAKPIVLQTRKGKPLLVINELRFNCKRVIGPKTYWVCNRAPKGCRVSIVTYEDVIVKVIVIKHSFDVTYIFEFNKLAVQEVGDRLYLWYKGFRYTRNQEKFPKTWWVCSKRAAMQCRASLVTLYNKVIKGNHTHTHSL
ncbi:FLYWCH zinc finger domain-containing protein [Phthorimaea operculella]|nr:FLYWCH zinc finger domain-containing protein [Phthorimaea operculella]